MGTRDDKTAARLRVERSSASCFEAVSRNSLRAHRPERSAAVRGGFLSRYASGQRDLNRPKGLRSIGGAAEEQRSRGAEEQRNSLEGNCIRDRTDRASHRGLSNHLGASAPQPLCSSAPQPLCSSAPQPLCPSALPPLRHSAP